MLTGRKGVVKDDDYSKTTFTTGNLPRVLLWGFGSSLGSGHFAASILGQQDADNGQFMPETRPSPLNPKRT